MNDTNLALELTVILMTCFDLFLSVIIGFKKGKQKKYLILSFIFDFLIFILILLKLLIPNYENIFLIQALFGNLIFIFLFLSLIPIYLLFVNKFCEDNSYVFKNAPYFHLVLGVLIYSILQLAGVIDITNINNYLNSIRNLFFIIWNFPLLCWFVALFVYKRKMLKCLDVLSILTFIVLQLTAIIIQYFENYFNFYELSVFLIQFFICCLINMEREKRLQIREREIADARISQIISQIQPHFLYNTLETIRYFCDVDPKQASEMIYTFAIYLRFNMDSLTRKAPIPFAQDLNHLKNYLFIEQKRFPQVKIEYNIQTEDFYLPALTLQPLVENSIKYGIREKYEGGTINISTFDLQEYVAIIIADNGVGFDTEKIKNDGRTHIGIENTKYRIENLCGGRFIIESKIGKGTVITIELPKIPIKNDGA